MSLNQNEKTFLIKCIIQFNLSCSIINYFLEQKSGAISAAKAVAKSDANLAAFRIWFRNWQGESVNIRLLLRPVDRSRLRFIIEIHMSWKGLSMCIDFVSPGDIVWAARKNHLLTCESNRIFLYDVYKAWFSACLFIQAREKYCSIHVREMILDSCNWIN